MPYFRRNQILNNFAEGARSHPGPEAGWGAFEMGTRAPNEFYGEGEVQL
jgi:hypothetical protein